MTGNDLIYIINEKKLHDHIISINETGETQTITFSNLDLENESVFDLNIETMGYIDKGIIRPH